MRMWKVGGERVKGDRYREGRRNWGRGKGKGEWKREVDRERKRIVGS